MSVIRRLALGLAVLATTALVAPAAGATGTSTDTAPGDPAATNSAADRPFFEFRTAKLAPVPHDPSADGGSSVTGDVALIRLGDQLIVLQLVTGIDGNLPHAQHVHGVGLGQCPTADRAGEDGLISTAEGVPDYGGVQVSLTTNGDTSPASALAVDRFPVANGLDFYLYGRVLTIGEDIPEEVGYDLDEYHVVVHGIDVNGNGAYDFDAGESSLDPSLPLEATVPAACGEIG